MNPPPDILRFDGIAKNFFGVKVLKEVTFSLTRGHTIGLIGENGAGKSTLMNILGGNLRPDSGQLLLDGKPFAPNSPRDAERHGVAFIHQELNLFPNLSIAENLFITGFPKRFPFLPFIDNQAICHRTEQLLAEVNLSHPPGTLVANLSAGERQLVEIARALSLNPRLIILDEPTTSLTARETERLFSIMAKLRERNISMIYISHNLSHVLQVCDGIAVLRDGQLVDTGPASQFSLDRLVSLMVGRSIDQFFPPRDTKRLPDVALELSSVSQPGIVRDISFKLHRGEVLGLSGLMGSGRSELARIIFGLDPCAAGEIVLDGALLNALTPRERMRRGLAFLTEDRRHEGLCFAAPIAENITLAALPRFTRSPARFVDRRQTSSAVEQMRRAVHLTPSARDEQPVRILSGGNQQKVVFAKWLLNQPKVLILDEPTRGIDVGAKCEVYRLINDLAAQGAAILMISSEVEELIGMCDRILVLSRGEIKDTIEPRHFDRERILRAAIHRNELA